jgi:hypothetical protein
LKKVLVLIVLAVLCAPLDAQYRARWSTPPQSQGGGGEPALPLEVSELLSSSSTDQLSSYASTHASFTEHAGATTFSCASGSLCLAWVTNTDTDTGGPDVPDSVSQTGQTWTLLGSVMENTPELRQSLYYTEGAGAAAAAITAAFPDAQNGLAFAVWEVENVDLTAGTSGIVRFNSAQGTNDGSSMTGSSSYTMIVDLTARNSGSAVLMGHATRQSCTTRTAKAGYTEGTAASFSTPTTRVRVDYIIDGADTAPAVALTGPCSQNNIDWVGISAEVSPDLSTDVTDPTVIITSPTIGTTYSVSNASFAFGGSAADNDSIPAGGVTWACATCTPTSGTATGTTSWSASNTLTCSGGGTANTITVTAEDPSANTSEDTLTVTCFNDDTIAPIVAVLNPATSPSSGSNPLVAFNGTITDNVAVDRVEYTAVGATPSSGTATLNAGAWSFTISAPCSAGGTSTTVEMIGYDSADNPSVTHTRVYVCVSSGDVTAPTVTVTSNCGSGAGADCSVTSPTATFHGTASDNVSLASVTGSCATCTPATWTASGTTTWSANGGFPVSLAAGTNTLCAVAHDTAGNSSSADCQVWIYTAPVTFTSGGCAPAQEDVAYGGCTITVTGGDGTYTLTDLLSELNTGDCSGLTGAQVGQTFVVSGTPTAIGTCGFTIRANDGVQSPVNADFTIPVLAVGTGPNAYFDTLADMSESVAITPCVATGDDKGCSLQDQTQLDTLTPGATPAAGPWWFEDATVGGGRLDWPRDRRWKECTFAFMKGQMTLTGTPNTSAAAGIILTDPVTGYTFRTGETAVYNSTGVSGNVVTYPTSSQTEPYTYYSELASPTGRSLTVTSGAATTAKVKKEIACTETESLPTDQQIKIPMYYEDGRIILTWDWLVDSAWRNDPYVQSNQLKVFKVQHGNAYSSPGQGQGWTLRHRLNAALDNDARTIGTDDQAVGTGYTPDGEVGDGFYSPTGVGAHTARTYQYRHSEWQRIWLEIKFYQAPSAFTEWNAAFCSNPANPCLGGTPAGTEIGGNPGDDTDGDGTVEVSAGEGRWHMITIWAASEGRDPEKLLYRVPIAWVSEGIARFDFELNSSSSIGLLGPHALDWTAWARNFHILRNYTALPANWQDDPVLFQRPVR